MVDEEVVCGGRRGELGRMGSREPNVDSSGLLGFSPVARDDAVRDVRGLSAQRLTLGSEAGDCCTIATMMLCVSFCR